VIDPTDRIATDTHLHHKMDHYTGAQWNAFPHVPLDEIQPGDLD
jgi:cell wall-associated NlpC family hydrolase